MRPSGPTKSKAKSSTSYDDIEEADNNLPTWWLLTFYGAVVFGLVYWFYFHEYAIGQLQPQKYAEAVAAAEAERSIVTDESLDALAADESAVAAGQEIFMAQCFACHDAKGQGREGLGPNLTDKYWVHGGAPTDIHATVTNGVAAKGDAALDSDLGRNRREPSGRVHPDDSEH